MKNYRVSVDSGPLEPEESLLEAVSPDSKIEKPIKSGFFVVFYFVVSAVFIVFSIVGFNLGIVKNNFFSQLSDRNKFITIPILPQRGLIYSKEGIVLSENKETAGLWLLPAKLDGGEKEEIVAKLSQILEVSPGSLSELIDNNSGKASFLIDEDVNPEEKEKIESLDLQSLVLVENNIRIYPGGEYFAHLIGYVSLVNEEDLTSNDSYQISDKIGRSGLERYYENQLRGQGGEVIIDRFEDSIKTSESKQGNSLILNIDSSLQEKIYQELDRGLREIGSGFSAAVALDPQTGKILALVSLPSYDSNSFVKGLSPEDYKLLFESRNEPLLNRTISGRFAPGSSIKPLIALAALEEEVISPQKKINAPGLITITNPYNPEIIYTFRDWRNHGLVNLREAIAHSSDIYFYTVGGGFYDIKGLGIERIAKYLKMFKLDSTLGIDLNGEAAGFIPTPEWKRQYRDEIWYQGDTFNVSIGQGDLLITPLWLASFIGAIGNGSEIYKPYIVDKVIDPNGSVIKTLQPEILTKISFKEENLKEVREGMKMAAKIGTAKVLSNLSFEVGAKSGTSEVIKGQSTNSWISVFAPYDNPQIVLTIMMESGREGSYIPHQIAYRILRDYLK